MANIAVQHEQQAPDTGLAPREMFSPLRLWRDMLRWDPFAQMLPSLPQEEQRALFSPDFDVKETKDAFVFKADLPGIDQKDVNVSMTDNRLTIGGKRQQEKEEKTDTTYRCERSFGSFSRSFTLPNGIDRNKVDADLKGGVLTVSVPKMPEAKPKQVNVRSS